MSKTVIKKETFTSKTLKTVINKWTFTSKLDSKQQMGIYQQDSKQQMDYLPKL